MAEAGTVDDTVRFVGAHKPDILVLDLNLADGPSLPAIARIREGSPDTRIVVLTMQTEPGFAREALRAGASGYVLKEAADEELVAAVRAAVDGRTYLNPELAARVASAPPMQSGPPDGLTEREAEVLTLIALGHTNGEIAQQLFLSVRTVETHRAHIQQKLRLSKRSELVRYAPRQAAHRVAVDRFLETEHVELRDDALGHRLRRVGDEEPAHALTPDLRDRFAHGRAWLDRGTRGAQETPARRVSTSISTSTPALGRRSGGSTARSGSRAPR